MDGRARQCLWLDCSPSGNRTKTIFILFGWLPCEMRHHAREVRGMLSCAASDFKDQTGACLPH
jgi:hypothetical protein